MGFNENKLELAIIDLFKQEGYIHQYGDVIRRKLTDILLTDDLKSFLSRRYNDLTKIEVERNT